MLKNPLPTRPLGASGFQVSTIGLGAMPLSLEGRPVENEAVNVLYAAFDAGITLVDTADAYCPDEEEMGHNERLVAKALRSWSGDKSQILVATKGGLQRTGREWSRNGKPEYLKEACDRSLRALGVETIRLYQFHAPDENVPFEDSVGALAELRSLGKILHVGLSNVSVEQIKSARQIVPVVSVQNRLNVFERESLTDGVVDYCARQGIAFLAYSAVGGHRGHVRTPTQPVLQAIAQRNNITPYQVCLAWLLQLSPVIIPIPGATKTQSVLSSASAAMIRLDKEALASLSSLSG